MGLLSRAIRAWLRSPVRMAATAALITPGAHLVLSPLLERRRVTWASDFPAVLIGDPVLAVSLGLAAHVAGPDAVLNAPTMRRPLAPIVVGGAVAFGAWQVCDEVRRGVYTRQQALSPTKLWHQFVVYPVLAPLYGGALLAAVTSAVSPGATGRQRAGAAATLAGGVCWAALVAEAVRNPRQGHGTFDWARAARAARSSLVATPARLERLGGSRVRRCGRGGRPGRETGSR